MCMNRYYVAEGVRLYAQESWRQVMGEGGRQQVAVYIDKVRCKHIQLTDVLWCGFKLYHLSQFLCGGCPVQVFSMPCMIVITAENGGFSYNQTVMQLLVQTLVSRLSFEVDVGSLCICCS